MAIKDSQGNIISETGNYAGKFGDQYDPNNLYTYGLSGFSGANFGNSGRNISQSDSSSSTTDGSLIGPYKERTARQAWNNLDVESQKYLIRKGMPDIDHGMTESGLVEAINRVIAAKGGTPISNLNQTSNSLSPLIQKRAQKGLGGIGGILGAVLPLAAMAIPGIGWAGAAALGAAGGALSGGGLKGALLGGALGGLGAGLAGASALPGGIATNAVRAISGPMAGQMVIPGVLNSAIQGPAVASSILGNTVGRSATGLESLIGLAKSTGSSLSTGSKLSNLLSSIQQPQQQQQQQNQQLTQDQIMALLQAKYGSGAQNQSIFLRAGGLAKGGNVNSVTPGRLIQGPGDGMSDSILGTINGTQPVRLADSEHVVPALQVSMLGRGSPKAGSQRVEELVRKELTKMYGKGVDPVAMQNKAMRKK